jgi:hypothetical protein
MTESEAKKALLRGLEAAWQAWQADYQGRLSAEDVVHTTLDFAAFVAARQHQDDRLPYERYQAIDADALAEDMEHARALLARRGSGEAQTPP